MSTLELTETISYSIQLIYPNPGGTPTPTIKIIWTLIRNNQVVSGVNFPTAEDFVYVPGHQSSILTGVVLNPTPGQTPNISLQTGDILRARIEASNIVSSRPAVLEASATISGILPQVQMKTVAIRRQGNGTTNIGTIPYDSDNDASGTILFVADSSNQNSSFPDVTFSNGNPIRYVWRRNGLVVKDTTIENTYTISEEDRDSELLVNASVTVSNTNFVQRTAKVIVGSYGIPSNTESRIGTVAETTDYWTNHNQFVNLLYSRTKNSTFNGPSGSANGWPLGEIPADTTNLQVTLILHEGETVIGGGIAHEQDRPSARRFGWRSLFQEDFPLDASWSRQITLSMFWEGDGDVDLVDGDQSVGNGPITSVTFAGPNGAGPFGDGPRQMRKRVWSVSRNINDGAALRVRITRSSAANPVRNILVLLPGFDETNYTPMMVNPKWVEKSGHYKIIRFFDGATGVASFDNGSANGEVTLRGVDTGIPSAAFWQRAGNNPPDTLFRPGWNTTYGVWSSPEHIQFARGLRAAIELCNTIGADLWWSHPYTVVRDDGWQQDGSNPIPAGQRDIWVDEEYVQGFAAMVNQYLLPGLKVYTEWSNESWNGWGTFGGSKRWAMNWAPRTKYMPEGWNSPGEANFVRYYDMLATAAIARELRQHIDATREVICTTNQQDAFPTYTNIALAMGHANPHARALLFGEGSTPGHLDAIGVAPYRDWPGGVEQITGLTSDQLQSGDFGVVSNPGQWNRAYTAPWPLGNFSRWQSGTRPQVGAGYMTVDDMASWWNALGAKLPWSHPDSWWNDRRGDPQIEGPGWTNSNQVPGSLVGTSQKQYTTRYNSLQWKRLCLDALPRLQGEDAFWSPWNRKQWVNGKIDRLDGSEEGGPSPRWNLQLVAYEMGQHNVLSREMRFAQYPLRRFRDLQYHPDYFEWYSRYIESLFSPGPARSESGALIENAEPIFDVLCHLNNVRRESNFGMFWGVLEYINQSIEERPRYRALIELVRRKVGTPNWWL